MIFLQSQSNDLAAIAGEANKIIATAPTAPRSMD